MSYFQKFLHIMGIQFGSLYVISSWLMLEGVYQRWDRPCTSSELRVTKHCCSVVWEFGGENNSFLSSLLRLPVVQMCRNYWELNTFRGYSPPKIYFFPLNFKTHMSQCFRPRTKGQASTLLQYMFVLFYHVSYLGWSCFLSKICKQVIWK